jgi:hypothetical protein
LPSVAFKYAMVDDITREGHQLYERAWRKNQNRRRAIVRPTVTPAAPLQFLRLFVASWLRGHHGESIEYLRAENRVLRDRLGPQRLRFTDPERRSSRRTPRAQREAPLPAHVG